MIPATPWAINICCASTFAFFLFSTNKLLYYFRISSDFWEDFSKNLIYSLIFCDWSPIILILLISHIIIYWCFFIFVFPPIPKFLSDTSLIVINFHFPHFQLQIQHNWGNIICPCAFLSFSAVSVQTVAVSLLHVVPGSQSCVQFSTAPAVISKPVVILSLSRNFVLVSALRAALANEQRMDDPKEGGLLTPIGATGLPTSSARLPCVVFLSLPLNITT